MLLWQLLVDQVLGLLEGGRSEFMQKRNYYLPGE
jgi:hypothetical protein